MERAPSARTPPADHGDGRPSPPSARQIPREVTATTTASTASNATPMMMVTSTRENHEAA
jgi:hypothetical protein